MTASQHPHAYVYDVDLRHNHTLLTRCYQSRILGSAYATRIRAAYPIHPELFDRLYEDWSTLEKFQRTRGVLRLMSIVIFALWHAEDPYPMIMPGTLPVSDARVFGEIANYLDDS